MTAYDSPSNPPSSASAGANRRTVLKAGAVAAAATGSAFALGKGGIGPFAPAEALAEDGAIFRHGVASGDPLSDRVILWTRVTPSPEATPGSGAGPEATVQWEMASDASFGAIERAGSVVTNGDKDHTVNVDAGGLAPDTWYYYRFNCNGQTSPVGRTRTAPAPGANPGRARFGVVSC